MSERFYSVLETRGIMTVAGADRAEFLQGLISNDVHKATPERALWSALLSPQGKFRHDFFLVDEATADGPRYLIDCEGGERLMDMGTTLRRYVLRSQVRLDIVREYAVTVAAGPGLAADLGLDDAPGTARALDGGGVAFVDPRRAEAGVRLLAPATVAREVLAAAGAEPAGPDAWDRVRIPLGLPDGSRDLEIDKAVLLENGFDELGGIDWQKGCYMGQELTARTRYRGLVKKRLVPVRIDGPAPAAGTAVTRGGKTAGELRSVAGDAGLALLRLKDIRAAAADGTPLAAGEATLTPETPDWMRLPDPEQA